jgi:hypothetical protein
LSQNRKRGQLVLVVRLGRSSFVASLHCKGFGLPDRKHTGLYLEGLPLLHNEQLANCAPSKTKPDSRVQQRAGYRMLMPRPVLTL